MPRKTSSSSMWNSMEHMHSMEGEVGKKFWNNLIHPSFQPHGEQGKRKKVWASLGAGSALHCPEGHQHCWHKGPFDDHAHARGLSKKSRVSVHLEPAKAGLFPNWCSMTLELASDLPRWNLLILPIRSQLPTRVAINNLSENPWCSFI